MVASSITKTTVLSGIPDRDWQELIGGERVSQREVAWRVKISEVSAFGGFYVKGHLLGNKSARVHLIWPPQATPSGAARDRLVKGAVVTVTGEFEGVTREHEAIVSVTKCVP